METCIEDFDLINAPTSAPTNAPSLKPTGALGDHSSFTQTRDCFASCRDCDEVEFTPYETFVQYGNKIPSDLFSDRTKCVCLHIDDTIVDYEENEYAWFEYLEDDVLRLTPYDDCVNFRGGTNFDTPENWPGFGVKRTRPYEHFAGGDYYHSGAQFRLGDGDDVVVGTMAQNLWLYAEDGDDTITLYGAGTAYLYGGAGDDSIRIEGGEFGPEDYFLHSGIKMVGGDGTDTCYTEAYQDYDYDIDCYCETCENAEYGDDGDEGGGSSYGSYGYGSYEYAYDTTPP